MVIFNSYVTNYQRVSTNRAFEHRCARLSKHSWRTEMRWVSTFYRNKHKSSEVPHLTQTIARKWMQFQFSDMPLSSIAVQNFANPFHSENPMAINGPFMIHLWELGTQPSLFQIYGILWTMISWWYPFSRHLNVSSHFAGQHLQVLAARPWQTLAFLPRKIAIWWEYEWRILMVWNSPNYHWIPSTCIFIPPQKS